MIIELAARHKLPAVYPARFFDGGLISYGPDRIDPYRRAAGYVDRILKVRSQPSCQVQAPLTAAFGILRHPAMSALTTTFGANRTLGGCRRKAEFDPYRIRRAPSRGG